MKACPMEVGETEVQSLHLSRQWMGGGSPGKHGSTPLLEHPACKMGRGWQKEGMLPIPFLRQ